MVRIKFEFVKRQIYELERKGSPVEFSQNVVEVEIEFAHLDEELNLVGLEELDFELIVAEFEVFWGVRDAVKLQSSEVFQAPQILVLVGELFVGHGEHLEVLNHGHEGVEKKFVLFYGQLLDVLNVLGLRQVVKIKGEVVEV